MKRLFLSSVASVALVATAPILAAPVAGDPPSDEIVVTAKKLDAARDAIQPSLGASEFKLDRAELDNQPQGGDRNLTQVLLQAPGVTQDSYGAVHVRNEHGNLQYRLNGIIVPEGVSGFGQTFDPRIAESIDLITGTLPAQYGYRTSGVVSVKTRGGAFDTGDDIGIYGGSQGTIQPSATLHGASGGLNYFFSGSYVQNDLGIENPVASQAAIHDRTEQYRGFGYVSDIVSDASRITIFAGTAIGHFQIPNSPGQTPAFIVSGVSTANSALLDQNQRETTHYGVLAYQYSAGAFNLQLAPFIRYSATRFSPDPAGNDIIFNGFADQSTLSSLALGIQADGSYKLSDAHTIRFGLFFQNERTRFAITSRVLPVDSLGNQTSDQPVGIPQAGGKTGQLFGAYLQDEWSLTPTLTLNAGVRYDVVRAYTREQQLSPRINLVYAPGKATIFHVGYARNFTPPPQELIGAATSALFSGTTRATEVALADPVRAEREDYFDGGVQQRLAPGLTVAVDTYYKKKRNLLDDGQFGASLVESPFNYARGFSWGVEARVDYNRGPLSLYANLARGQEKARAIISSEYFFAAQELAYIAGHNIFTDHSQRWTASGGGSLSIPDGLGKLVPSADFVYGDGLRTADATGTVPNGGKLPGYVQVNCGIAQDFDGPGVFKGISLRLDVTNLFDASYQIRDGAGIGVGAPQYGPRRAFFVGVRKAF
jgi:outer membrane receptor protein involved in Fe transport